jgi:hypothetical protein
MIGFPSSAIRQAVLASEHHDGGGLRAITRPGVHLIVRLLNWDGGVPDDEPGFTVLVAQLQALSARMAQGITDHRNGLIDSRAALPRNQEVRLHGSRFRISRQGHTCHRSGDNTHFRSAATFIGALSPGRAQPRLGEPA